MAKPTLIQAILKRPSQSYAFPQKKEYFSSKRQLLRVVAAEESGQGRESVGMEGDECIVGVESVESGDGVIVEVEPSQHQQQEQQETDDQDTNTDDDNGDEELFYTPFTTPRNSFLESPDTLFPPPHSTSSHSDTTSSIDNHSIFSSFSMPSTRVTTPVTSDSGHLPPPTKASVPRRTNTTSSTRTYPDQEWAKDVRWLAPPPPPSRSRTHSRSNSYSSEKSSSSLQQPKPPPPPGPPTTKRSNSLRRTDYSFSSFQQFPTAPLQTPQSQSKHKPHPPPRKSHKKSKSHSVSSTTPSIMMSMSALLEEDEDLQSSTAGSHSQPHTPSRHRTASSPHRTSSTTLKAALPPQSQPTPSSHISSRHPRRKRSSSLPQTPPSLIPVPSTSTSAYTPSLPSHGTPGYTSLTLPRAHTLAGAGPSNTRASTDPTQVDLTRSGIAQTTMASVEVVRGLGAMNVGKGVGALTGLFRRRSSSNGNGNGARPGGGRGASESGSGSGSELNVDRASLRLGFTSHRAPPSHVPSGSVLVQVWAVGLDTFDSVLVRGGSSSSSSAQPQIHDGNLSRDPSSKEKDTTTQKPAAVGFVPGRSFVGRVLECGWEVRDTVVRRGEWVVGLLDLRKSGALAEFIVVDRRRIHRVSHPRTTSSPIPISKPSRSLSRSLSLSASQATPPPQSALTLEELALLPLTGVPAHRAVRTFLAAFPEQGAASGGGGNKERGGLEGKAEFERGRERRALVINGHVGAGAMAVQMLIRYGWSVSVHAPGHGLQHQQHTVPLADGPEKSQRRSAEEEAYMQHIEGRVREWGADEVIFDDGLAGREGPVVRMLGSLCDEGERFDGVLDTVGGRAVWEAGERLLKGGFLVAVGEEGEGGGKKSRKGFGFGLWGAKRGGGRKGEKGGVEGGYAQFTTLVGDVPGRAVPSAGDHFRAGLRAMRVDGDTTTTTNSNNVKSATTVTTTTTTTTTKTDRRDAKGKTRAKGRVGYAWVSAAQDVDWEGADVGEALGAVLAVSKGPDGVVVGGTGGVGGTEREREGVVPVVGGVVPFERAPEVFADGEGDVIGEGGTVVVRVVG